ncbi:MAG TPA: hypothetical protein VLV17_06315 [Anaeromyxobacteraceae bacterium]|nr:hypothetical protein [Anaeromyxobacteraceae bacterium]
MNDEPDNTIITLMTVSREETLKQMPWWRRQWRRVWGPTHEEWVREFDAAVKSAPRRKND